MRLLCHQYQVMAFKEGERLEKEALLRLQQVNLNKPGVEKGASGDQNGIKTERKRSDSMETDMPHSSDNTLLQNGGSTPSLTSSQSVCVCSGQPRPCFTGAICAKTGSTEVVCPSHHCWAPPTQILQSPSVGGTGTHVPSVRDANGHGGHGWKSF